MFGLFEDITIATCIGCGCTDDRACPEGCAWMRLDRSTRRGVCTQCVDHVAAWDDSHMPACDIVSPTYTQGAGRPLTYRPVATAPFCSVLRTAPVALKAASPLAGHAVHA